jgi:hypothetical protein
MAGKSKLPKLSKSPKLWINPKSPLVSGNDGSSGKETPDIYKARFLELADVLEPQKPGVKAKRKADRRE